jgi:hypothetical protein
MLGLLVVSACTSSKDPYIHGFAPPAEAKGYTRFITPTITDLNPGDDQMFCQWLEVAHDSDRQIVDTLGYQSVGGHHVALYTTTGIEAVGTSRICTAADMLHVSFVGAVGAEGLSAAKLPDGMAFTVPMGSMLMANTHYINATDSPIEGQSVVDVKFGDPAHPLPGAGFLAVNWDQFTIPANSSTTSDAYCKATRDSSFFMWANHMHEWGSHTMSEIIHPDGTKALMAQDDTWSKDKTFDPAWVRWDTTTPFKVNAGDTFHVQCNWDNTTSSPIKFPVEMCVSTGFTLEEMPQSICEATNDPANPGS